jgi:hypothetical protein
MNIEAKNFKINISYGELWATAFDVQSSLENTIKNHWVHHQQNWKQNEADRINRLRDMFYALGRPDIYENTFERAETIFKDFAIFNENQRITESKSS